MTMSLVRFMDTTSPVMLIISASLHALVLIAIVVASSSIQTFRKPIADGVSTVKLVALAEAPLLTDKARQGPVKTREIELDSLIEEPSDAEQVVSAREERVETRVAEVHSSGVITVNRRTRALQKVEPPPTPPKKNAEAEEAKKKPSDTDFLEQRMKAIRNHVEARKTDTPASGASQKTNSSESSRKSASQNGGEKISEDTTRWFEAVRGLINSHWSAFGDARKLERFTVVGVRIDDDGRLTDASVDESSGDPLFDRSAIRAIVQASPFPPVPLEVRERIRNLGGLALRFTPTGIQ